MEPHHPPPPVNLAKSLVLSKPIQVYVRRQRLPKDWKHQRLTRGPFFGEGEADASAPGEADCVSELDLAVGKTVQVWGTELRLVGCDAFTRDYYR